MTPEELKDIQRHCDPSSDLYQAIDSYFFHRSNGDRDEAEKAMFYVGYCYASHTGLREAQQMDYYKTKIQREKRAKRKSDTPSDIVHAVQQEGKRLHDKHGWTRSRTGNYLFAAQDNLGRAIRHHVITAQSVIEWLEPIIPAKQPRKK